MKSGMNRHCLIYRVKKFLLPYFTERQEKGKEVFPEFRFYTTHIKLRRKLKENRGRRSKNKKGSQATAVSVPFQPSQDINASSMIFSRILSPMGSKTQEHIP